MSDEHGIWDELFGQQHNQDDSGTQSPDYTHQYSAPEASSQEIFGRSTEIDLVEESEEWISGFDAGFTGRPFGSGNTEQYHKGYLDGQHEWLDQITSPATASVFTETSSPAQFDATLIDPQLLALDASHDDPLITPTQSSQITQDFSGHSSTVSDDHKDVPPLFISDASQENVQESSPVTPRPLNTPFGGTHPANGRQSRPELSSSRFDLCLSSPVSKLHAASSPVREQRLITPTKSRAGRRRVPAPVVFALS